jgi:hypothetical protein
VHQLSKRDLWLPAQYSSRLAGIADQLIYLGWAIELGIADHIVSIVEAEAPESLVSLPMTTGEEWRMENGEWAMM